MSAQFGPRLTGWNFHGLPSSFAGCSHQPPVQSTSCRPSPLTSPTPSPCAYLNVPGTSFLGLLGSLMGCISHGCVGSLPGLNQAICPSCSFFFGCQPMTRTRLPVPNRSAYRGVSLQALCQTKCCFHGPGLPRGFSYQ